MRITKVYTRGGDTGMTSLVGGKRVAKNDRRIGSYGTVDELNAVVGLARTFNDETSTKGLILDRMFHRIQNDLFNLGADLATPEDSRWEGMYRVGDEDVARLEGWIDSLNEDLGALEEFILPGGGPVGAFLHQARTVCRRAERQVVSLMEQEQIGEGPVRYLNRLSDFLFVAGRWAASALGEPEFLWERPGDQ